MVENAGDDSDGTPTDYRYYPYPYHYRSWNGVTTGAEAQET
ncbi:unnamed protein product, partial [marine sediment metagenome]